MTVNTLLIRADANTLIGTGHVMRCLALAQAWQDNGGTVTFLMEPGSPSLEQRIRTEGMNVLTITDPPGSKEDAATTDEYANKIEASWVVVDGYQFDAEYHRLLKAHNCKVLFIDDFGHANHYYADIVLNQNIYADISLYKKYESYTRFLLGTNFVLLRREFLKYSHWHRDIPEVAHKVLITLGGSDPDNITLKIIEALKTVDIDGLEVKVVVGGSNPHVEYIYDTVKDLSNFTLIKNADNMPVLMAWADMAISAGGSTCWELAFMGVPSILYPIAENQKRITQGLHNVHAAVGLPLGDLTSIENISQFVILLLNNKKMRFDLSQSQRKIVDGTGSKTIVSKLNGE